MDFKPSKDYFTLFQDAKKINNVDRMSELFRELAAEVGISDPDSTEAQRSAAKNLAELRNAQDAGTGKKI